MFQNVYNILVEILGESKQGYYSEGTEQYQFDCCRCAEDNDGIPDGKHNLEVLLSPSRGLKYHCWKCGDTDNMRGNLGTLIKKYGNTLLYKQYKEEVDTIKKSRLYDINLFGGEDNIEGIETFLKLPKTYKKIDLSTLRDRRLKSYLEKRCITQDIIDRFNIGYTEWENEDWDVRNKIVIPSYDITGDLNFYVCRDYTGKSKIKYKNCDSDKLNIIFQESLIDWDSSVFLVEGAIDCLFLPNSLSLLGKTLVRKSELYNSLLRKTNGKIVICLDGDTDINETKKIYSMLNFSRLRNKIWYIRMGTEEIPYKDFGELYESEGKSGILRAVRSMKQFEEIDLIY
jgi:hypothetical protein